MMLVMNRHLLMEFRVLLLSVLEDSVLEDSIWAYGFIKGNAE